jgi:hypothetical protein
MAATNTSLLNFDRYQFAGRRIGPVHAEYIAGEIETTGLAYEDRMSTFMGSRPVHRRKGVPSWAINTSELRELITHFMERRAGYRVPQKGTHAERLSHANARLAAKVPRLTATLDKLCHEYVAAKKQDPTSSRVRELQVEIENIDTQLMFIKKTDALVAGVVFHSYNLGENSVEVAKALGIRPPHVRAILHRLNIAWNRMPERAAAAAAKREAKPARKRKYMRKRRAEATRYVRTAAERRAAYYAALERGEVE